MSLDATVHINLDRLCANAASLKKVVGDFYCVLKCDAYGHGAKECASALQDAGFKRFAVYSLEQALQIAKVTPKADILILGRTPGRYIDTVSQMGFVQTVFSREYLDELKASSCRSRVHIKLDCGMNRTGFKCSGQDIKKAFFGFRGEIEGVYTHFHCADLEDESITLSELDGFKSKASELEILFSKRLIKHSAASAAALRFPLARMDISRIGLALYGIFPDNCVGTCKLEPVMSFRAPIVSVNKVKKGENIGYGCDCYAKNDAFTAIVSAGYANGLHRSARYGLAPAINGYRVPFAANICMDRCILDISELAYKGVTVRPYDEVEFFGDGIAVSEAARSTNTIPYELITQIGALNKRRY